MKAVLEFDLPEEKDEYKEAINGHKYFIVIVEYLSNMRAAIKYGDIGTLNQQLPEDQEPLTESDIPAIEKMRDILIAMAEEKGLFSHL